MRTMEQIGSVTCARSRLFAAFAPQRRRPAGRRPPFVPPHHTRVATAIDDLARFMRRDDLAVLPQAALAHAQFETIHPFPHGNGRTGRALVDCLLRGKRLTRQVTVPVSAGDIAPQDVGVGMRVTARLDKLPGGDFVVAVFVPA